MPKKVKQIEMPKQVFTTVNTQVDEILEELVQWSQCQSHANLKLEAPKLKEDDELLRN